MFVFNEYFWSNEDNHPVLRRTATAPLPPQICELPTYPEPSTSAVGPKKKVDVPPPPLRSSHHHHYRRNFQRDAMNPMPRFTAIPSE